MERKMSEKTSNSKLLTRGGQILFNNIRMLVQVNRQMARWVILLTVLQAAVIVWSMTSYDVIQATYYYASAWVFAKVGLAKHVFNFLWHGDKISVDTVGVLNEAYFSHQVAQFCHNLKTGLFIGFGTSFVLMVWFSFWLIRKGKKQNEKRFIRGARLVEPSLFAKAVKKYGASDIVVSGIPMVRNFEVEHTLIHGTTGSGKGQTFNQFIEQIRKRGDSAIVFDKGCVFTSLFFDEQADTILNPFDERCAHWDLWSEARTEPDFENIAESLIPMHGESDPYWVDAARTVFSAVANRMKLEEDRSIDKLLSLILTAELDVLGAYLKGTQAATLVSDKIEKTAISIRSVISTYLKSLRFLRGLETKQSFAIRDWIKEIADSKDSQFLFISSNAEQHAALRPLISMWLSMASISLLSLSENHERRIWFICDELPSLHKLPQLGESIAEVRKFGGCFVLGMQSYSQLKKVYGQSAASEIFDLLNTRFFFRSPSADMAAIVSKELGQEDIEQSNESYSYGANTIRDGISIGTQRVTRPLISPAEIMEMPNLQAYVRVPAPVPITKIKMTYQERKKIADGFQLRYIPESSREAEERGKPKPKLDNPEENGSEATINTTEAEQIADTSQPVIDAVHEDKDLVGEKCSSMQIKEPILADKKEDKEYETFI